MEVLCFHFFSCPLPGEDKIKWGGLSVLRKVQKLDRIVPFIDFALIKLLFIKETEIDASVVLRKDNIFVLTAMPEEKRKGIEEKRPRT